MIENENIRDEVFFGPASKARDIKEIQLLVVHHSARKYNIGENYKTVIVGHAHSHKNKTWGYYSNGQPIKGNGLQYHYVVAPDGRIYKTRNWSEITWHANNANPTGLGIMVMGNFQIQNPTQEQLYALEKLLKYLVDTQDLVVDKSDVFAHGELTQYGNNTACCGYNLKDDVKRFRGTGEILKDKYSPHPDFEESFSHWLNEGVFTDKTDPNRKPTWQESVKCFTERTDFLDLLHQGFHHQVQKTYCNLCNSIFCRAICNEIFPGTSSIIWLQ